MVLKIYPEIPYKMLLKLRESTTNPYSAAPKYLILIPNSICITSNLH